MDFSEHPVNAGKREEWKRNGRSNLERRKEKQTLAQRRELTTLLALPSSIEDVCFCNLGKNVLCELSQPLGRFNLGDLNLLCRSP